MRSIFGTTGYKGRVGSTAAGDGTAPFPYLYSKYFHCIPNGRLAYLPRNHILCQVKKIFLDF
ncbi:hypothetical protein [Microcoleus sp. S11D4]|uniref:hypothetical protein n=1 Tax=Microcoleus sp. S11D4 TaxID=3055407 RepID=UPI002FCFC2DD